MRGSKISNRNSNRKIAYKNTLRKFLFTKKKEIVEAVEAGHICKCYSCTKCLRSITVDDDFCPTNINFSENVFYFSQGLEFY